MYFYRIESTVIVLLMGAWCRCVLLTEDTPTWLMFQKPSRLGYLMKTVNETYMRTIYIDTMFILNYLH